MLLLMPLERYDAAYAFTGSKKPIWMDATRTCRLHWLMSERLKSFEAAQCHGGKSTDAHDSGLSVPAVTFDQFENHRRFEFPNLFFFNSPFDATQIS